MTPRSIFVLSEDPRARKIGLFHGKAAVAENESRDMHADDERRRIRKASSFSSYCKDVCTVLVEKEL